MSRFDDCLTFVLRAEGGYSNNPADRGGSTNRGITQVTLNSLRSTMPTLPDDVRDLTLSQTAAIYNAMYWQKCGCPSLPAPLDLLVFDSAVNCGVSRAVKWLQHVVGAKEDGLFGIGTKDALDQECDTNGVRDVGRRFLDLRQDHYDELVENNPSQAVFAKGWNNRMDALNREVA